MFLDADLLAKAYFKLFIGYFGDYKYFETPRNYTVPYTHKNAF